MLGDNKVILKFEFESWNIHLHVLYFLDTQMAPSIEIILVEDKDMVILHN